MDSAKPILPPGYRVTDGVTAVRRLDRAFFVEVYTLSDGSYLFLSLKPGRAFESSRGISIKTPTGAFPAIISKTFYPSLMLDISREFEGGIGLSSVAGMKALKAMLFNDVISPLKDPERYRRFRIEIPNGILLFGPPGCGKTFIVKKLAEELRYHFIELRPSSVATPYVHGAVSNIAQVFAEAKRCSPSIVFIDELDALLPKREELSGSADIKKEEINEFLLQLNNAGSAGIVVIGATNRPQMIDTAILRSGRMDKRIYVPPPDDEARSQLFRLCLKGRPTDQGIDFEELTKLTEGYVGSDIELIVTEAARRAVRGKVDTITRDILLEAVAQVTPSVSRDELRYYEGFASIERW